VPQDIAAGLSPRSASPDPFARLSDEPGEEEGAGVGEDSEDSEDPFAALETALDGGASGEEELDAEELEVSER
jgi:hypothetical protein